MGLWGQIFSVVLVTLYLSKSGVAALPGEQTSGEVVAEEHGTSAQSAPLPQPARLKKKRVRAPVVTGESSTGTFEGEAEESFTIPLEGGGYLLMLIYGPPSQKVSEALQSTLKPFKHTHLKKGTTPAPSSLVITMPSAAEIMQKMINDMLQKEQIKVLVLIVDAQYPNRHTKFVQAGS